MTKAQLNKMIEDEVSKITREPLREPVVQRPQHAVHNHVLKTEEEVDETLFGKKEKLKLKR